jgi:hypothetical protein
MAHAASNSVVNAQIKALADEVAALRVRANQRWRPWYRDLAVIVALLAFIFSVGTTAFSYLQANEQRIHDYRAELRNLTQRLSALPAAYLEATNKYDLNNPSDRATIRQLNRQYEIELKLLARQAASVIERIPDGQVSSAEYGTVGVSLQMGGLLEQGRQMARKAVMAARDASDRILALQLYGQSLFYAADYPAAREQFRAALSEIDNDAAMTADQKASQKVTVLGVWIEAELSQGLCAQAQERMRELLDQKTKISNPVLAAPFTSAIVSLQNQIDACGPSSAPQTPLFALPTPTR